MFDKRFIAVLLAVILFGFHVRADGPGTSVKPNRSHHQINKVEIDIPSRVDGVTQNSIIDKLSKLEQDRFVYLDLSIKFSASKNEPPPFSVLFNGKPKASEQRSGCEIGALQMTRGLSYELGPVANYNHLLMSVYTGERSLFPYNDISCEYVSGGEVSSFRIRGFFYVIANNIPTAISLQLRPFNPPFEIAAKTLAR